MKTTERIIVLTISIFILSLWATTVYSAVTADTIFTGGKVYTVNKKQPWAEAVAVAGNKIAYVGDAAGAEGIALQPVVPLSKHLSRSVDYNGVQADRPGIKTDKEFLFPRHGRTSTPLPPCVAARIPLNY